MSNTMYLKDKNTRITLRVNPKQMSYIKSKADAFGVSPSEYLRMIVNVNMFNEEEGHRRENEETNCNNIV